MTKLMQWIAGLVVFLAIYIPILTKMVVVPALEPYDREIKLLPFILIAFFGVRFNLIRFDSVQDMSRMTYITNL